MYTVVEERVGHRVVGGLRGLRLGIYEGGGSIYNSAATIARCLQTVADQSLSASRIEVLVIDDYLGPEALHSMTASARRHRSDVVVGRYVGVDRSAPNVLGAEELPEVHEYHPGWLNSLHIQKLFRTDFLRGLGYRFDPQLNYANDHPFMLNTFLHAQRVSFVTSVDCYFITLAEHVDGPGHISRAALSPTEQLRFLHDCFGLLALARGQGGMTAQLAGRMRADYWNRLLKLHLPMLILRKSDDDDAAELGGAAAHLAEIYGAKTSRSRLAPGATRMLAALNTADGPQLVGTAHAVRQNPNDDG